MRAFTVQIGEKEHSIDVDGAGRWSIDGAAVEASLQETEPGVYSVLLGGCSYRIVARNAGGEYLVLLEGMQRVATVETERARLLRKYARAEGAVHHRLEIHAPMPALVGRLLVTEGEEVRAGQALLVLEAMKMENEIKARREARVKEIVVTSGQTVEKGQLLIILE